VELLHFEARDWERELEEGQGMVLMPTKKRFGPYKCSPNSRKRTSDPMLYTDEDGTECVCFM